MKDIIIIIHRRILCYLATDLFLVHFESVPIGHLELRVLDVSRVLCGSLASARGAGVRAGKGAAVRARNISRKGRCAEHTVSGVSSGRTRVPSNRNRTVEGCFPCLSQNASINFFNWVVRLILKNTSLLLSVTLMLRCSTAAGASPESAIVVEGMETMRLKTGAGASCQLSWTSRRKSFVTAAVFEWLTCLPLGKIGTTR